MTSSKLLQKLKNVLIKTSMETMPGSALSEKAELVIHIYKPI